VYKEKAKSFHDKRIVKQNLEPGQMVLLFNSRLRLFPGRLKSKWSGPFIIKEGEPYGTIVLEVQRTKSSWTVNGQRWKPYFGGEVDRQMSTILLSDP